MREPPPPFQAEGDSSKTLSRHLDIGVCNWDWDLFKNRYFPPGVFGPYAELL